MKKQMAILLTSLMLLTGCSSEPQTETTAPPTATTAPTIQAETEPETTYETEPQAVQGPIHPLTGEALSQPYSEIRPYAVMTNNIWVAQPQCGLSQAEIVYEALAEGGVTRMMVLYSDLTTDVSMGSIRSLRPYYLSIARAYDAIVLHAGGSEQAYSDLETTGWDHIDGVNGPNSGSYYYRVQARIDNAGYEHSMFIDGLDAIAYAQEQGCRAYHEDTWTPFTFTDEPLSTGETAENVAVFFRGKETTFTYDPETNLYAGAQYDKPWADGNNDQVLTFRNLLILFAETETVDDYGRLAIDLVGTGTGYHIRDGKYIPIHWSREQEDAPFTYTLEDGTPLDLGVGKTYVGIVPPDSPPEFG